MRLHGDGCQDSRPLPLSVQPLGFALGPGLENQSELARSQGAEIIVGEAEASEGYSQGLLDGR